MGCAVAAELARRRPEAVAGLLLFNAPVYSSPERMREIVGRQNLLTRLSLLSPLAARLVCEAAVCTPRPLLTRIAPWLRPDVPPEAASDYFRHTFVSYYTSLTNLVMSGGLMPGGIWRMAVCETAVTCAVAASMLAPGWR